MSTFVSISLWSKPIRKLYRAQFANGGHLVIGYEHIDCPVPTDSLVECFEVAGAVSSLATAVAVPGAHAFLPVWDTADDATV